MNCAHHGRQCGGTCTICRSDKLQNFTGIWALRIGPRTAAGATLRGARGWPRNWITLFILRIFCALDGWEYVGDPELLDDTSEQFRRQKHFDLETP